MRTATFVLSTGRCGTQWLAEKLKQGCGDLVAVEHEPLDNDYDPRRMLGVKTPLDLGHGSSSAILDHLAKIERHMDRGTYVECGHPCWSALPWLTERLIGRIRIIHLTRHPIPTALSWLTHSAYEPPHLPHIREKILLSPFDDGVAFPEYRERWGQMNAFEKCLYYWAEVNALGLRLEETAGVPWLRIAFDELFSESGLARVLDFIGVTERAAMGEAGREVIDEYHFKAASAFPDPGALSRHPRFVEVAARLGYEPSWDDVDGLRRRYLPPQA